MKVTEPDSLSHWDLSNVYPSLESPEFKKAFSDLKSQLDELDNYLLENKIGRIYANPVYWNDDEVRKVVDGYVDRTNKALRLHDTLNAYVTSFVATDSYNTTAKRLESCHAITWQS